MIPQFKANYAGKGKLRKSAYHRGYTKTWQKVRALYLKHNPICCEPGCEQLATQVDHKKRIEEGGAIYDWSNLQAFCAKHHSLKTIREDGGFGNAKISHD